MKKVLYLEQADLDIQWEAVEGHGADEGDPGGHCVHDLKILVQPKSFQFRENMQSLELLKIQDLCVREPELFDE